MAVTLRQHDPIQVHKLPTFQYVSAVRFLPSLSPFTRHLLFSLSSSSSAADAPSLQLCSLSQTQIPALIPLSSFTLASPTTSLSAHPSLPFLAFSTASSLHFLTLDSSAPSFDSHFSEDLDVGTITSVDVGLGGGVECVSVGEDGRVNLAGVREGGSVWTERVFDSLGLVSYTSARWGSVDEFATGGYGFGMCWWDKRKPGGQPATQFKWKGATGKASGIIHSIDIHPSRKHICLAGGSLGTIFAWDRRWQKEPIFLSGLVAGGEVANSVCESEVWEILCDPYVQPQGAGNVSSSAILPVMSCSEDGILAVVKEGEKPIELMAEPCAINSFDINSHNPSEVVCSLEWESIAFMSRP